jgi:hypothetical protein
LEDLTTNTYKDIVAEEFQQFLNINLGVPVQGIRVVF